MKATTKRPELSERDYVLELALIADIVSRAGGVSVPDNYFDKWQVETVFGPLSIEVSRTLNFIACRFKGKPQDRPHFAQLPAKDHLNHYSGKWNSYASKGGWFDLHESILLFEDRLCRVVKVRAG